jgi:hypothetical protein
MEREQFEADGFTALSPNKTTKEGRKERGVALGLVPNRSEWRVVSSRIDSLAQRFEQLPSSFRIIFTTRPGHNKRS